ncbi:MAG TPA: hypothetical protein DDW93_04295 [Firmicutes bacterium]|nr:hypothetical protein [Bacillota bacterium]HBK69766.1 hypothetical protein [Bacillota bacterium]HBT17119.1 hypothetical protein [Bacillota bacterium]
MFRTRVLLLTILLTIAVASCQVKAGLYDTYPDFSFLILSTPIVRLGDLKTDPLDPTHEYFETTNALSVLFYTQSSKWEVVMSGSDFQSGSESIPLRQMEWKKEGANYKKMSSPGKNTVLAKAQGEGNLFYMLNLSFRLVLEGVEIPGRYGNTMVISMIFP